MSCAGEEDLWQHWNQQEDGKVQCSYCQKVKSKKVSKCRKHTNRHIEMESKAIELYVSDETNGRQEIPNYEMQMEPMVPDKTEPNDNWFEKSEYCLQS